MKRTPEPELMLDQDQAAAYDAADFDAPHQRVIDLFRKHFPRLRPHRALDLGCGPGDIAIRFARAYPGCHILGVDGAPAMLDCGRRRLRRERDVASCIRLVKGQIQTWKPPRRFPVIFSNSLLHHLHNPDDLWNCVLRSAEPGAQIFIVDLRRPPNARAARRLQKLHTVGEAEVLRRDFLHSLHAAFTPAEIRAQLRKAGLSGLHVRAIGDRHVVVWGCTPKRRTGKTS